MSSYKSLQERIVSEIESTYNSITAYKNRIATNSDLSYKDTSKQRVKIIEHKLKTLKMMLAKVDDGDYRKCQKCKHPILISQFRNPNSAICTKCTS